MTVHNIVMVAIFSLPTLVFSAHTITIQNGNTAPADLIKQRKQSIEHFTYPQKHDNSLVELFCAAFGGCLQFVWNRCCCCCCCHTRPESLVRKSSSSSPMHLVLPTFVKKNNDSSSSMG